jgi:hypothetical protein
MEDTGTTNVLLKRVVAATHSQYFLLLRLSHLKLRYEVQTGLDNETVLVLSPTPHVHKQWGFCFIHMWGEHTVICSAYTLSCLDTAGSSAASKEYLNRFLAVFCNY